MPERLTFPAEATHLKEDATLHLAQVSLQQEVQLRGDRQFPDEPNRGFTIERLDSRPEQLIPLSEAFPSPKDEFVRHYLDGSIPLHIVEDAWGEAQRTGRPSFTVYFPIASSEYQKAVASDEVQGGLFDMGAKFHSQSQVQRDLAS